jgi:hypothetical protein
LKSERARERESERERARARERERERYSLTRVRTHALTNWTLDSWIFAGIRRLKY